LHLHLLLNLVEFSQLLEFLLLGVLATLKAELLVEDVLGIDILSLGEFLVDNIDISERVDHLGDSVIKSSLEHDLLDGIVVSELLELLSDSIVLSTLVEEGVDFTLNRVLKVQATLLELGVDGVAGSHLEDLAVGQVGSSKLLELAVNLVHSSILLEFKVSHILAISALCSLRSFLLYEVRFSLLGEEVVHGVVE